MSNVMTFSKKYAFLSASHSADFEWDGRIYHCCEAAFQSAKSLDPYERRRFTEMNGVAAKREGRKLTLRRDWEMVKDEIMEEIVLAKFSQNPKLAKKLTDTGDMELVYGNRLKETYWGVDEESGVGENRLGKILMKVRELLRDPDTMAAVEKARAQRASERMKQRIELQLQLNQVREQIRELPAYNLVGKEFTTRAYGKVTIDRREGNFLVFKHRGTEKRVALPGCIVQGLLVPEDEEIREAYRQYGMLLEYLDRLEKVLEAME